MRKTYTELHRGADHIERLDGMDGWNVAPVCLVTGKSDEACPLCEVREGKT